MARSNSTSSLRCIFSKKISLRKTKINFRRIKQNFFQGNIEKCFRLGNRINFLFRNGNDVTWSSIFNYVDNLFFSFSCRILICLGCCSSSSYTFDECNKCYIWYYSSWWSFGSWWRLFPTYFGIGISIIFCFSKLYQYWRWFYSYIKTIRYV